ncbi:putative ABC transport system ATP-binding protein [Dyadobacter sp. BE34]|uniref:ABC transport system ATP-binding protein n=1 Tax=Dyadobacter fermentans TaxID=94254 RepID=A0ABU1R5G5_9BACT|nr:MULTISPECIES: ABC transporter ATP-binding protein [Dyadobacter]MDR6808650.1 putative ABC transport system ATP-binding protein [Dyadobacter fermentans]MDR7046393.1 putative ABC transport system ATP-binding protein [Dyadobacter sp. BE242]MDR7200706.1 putative ABC transport system ATP-binding protein [Dyadobacter sp. BE34]MDR7218666.1 putative ABC transport system ATP-binding protein [Dyadobacter sp. BE31]MDR7266596.1 putative ABC transport system ATP-binding protein [Dyadobacter sp. BE32]
MLQTSDLTKTFTNGTTLHFPDWTVTAGEQWLLLGESGSGKTTLLHMLGGLLKPSEGKVMVNATNVYALPARALDRFRGQHIGIVFQQPHLIRSMTVEENLLLAQSFAGIGKDIFRIREVLNALEMDHKRHAYPQELSQGQAQRVGIARALVNRPALLLADEPTSSLDNRNADAVIRLLSDLATSERSTLIVCTHDDRVKESFFKDFMFELRHEHISNQLEKS